MLSFFADLKKELKEIYRYRYVIYSFTQIKLKQRYRRSFLGYLWTIFTPLINYLIMGTVISFIARGAKIENYTFYFISASVFFNYLNNVLSGSYHALIGNENFIKKIYFPKSIFFINLISLEIINFFITFFTLYLLAIVFNLTSFSPGFLLSLLTAVISIPLLFGLGVLIGVGSVYFRDLLHIIPAMLQAAYFLTPILYSVEMVPPKYHFLIYINPLYYFVECFRRPMMNYAPATLEYFTYCMVFSLASFLMGFAVLKKMENKIVFKL